MFAGCAGKQPPLPIYGQVPGFELISENGQPFDRKSLDGKIWVADFIFTTCSGPCPRMPCGTAAQIEPLGTIHCVGCLVTAEIRSKSSS